MDIGHALESAGEQAGVIQSSKVEELQDSAAPYFFYFSLMHLRNREPVQTRFAANGRG